MKKNLKLGRIEILLAAILLLVFAYQVTLGIFGNSITFDEPSYLAGGMNILRNSDYRFNSEAVVIPQLIEALPAALSKNVSFPAPGQKSAYEQWNFAEKYIYKTGNDADFILYSARFMVLLFGLFAGLAVYAWSRRLFGVKSALVSLFFFSFSPSILAHSGIAASDMITSFFFLTSLCTVWYMMEKINLLSALAASLSLSMLFLSKYSAFFFILIFIILAAFRIFSRRPLAIDIFKIRKTIDSRALKLFSFLCCGIVHAIVIFVMIWTFYSFRYSMTNFETSRDVTKFLWSRIPDDSSVSRVIKFAADKHILPEAYLYGFVYTYTHSANRNAFLNGSYSKNGWWYFFPYAFLVKTNPGLLVVLLFAAFVFIKRRNLFYKIIPFLIFIAVYMFFAMTGKMNIGHRHILPIYPMLFILVGLAGTFIDFKRKRIPSILTLMVCAATPFSTLSISPHYLAYFNFIAGGPSNGYKHLVDSSLDWGQGISSLKSYLDKDAPRRNNVYFSQFGSVPFSSLGLDAMGLPSYFPFEGRRIFNFHGGLYCISATMYQLVYYPEFAAWIPEADIYYKNIYPELKKIFEDKAHTYEGKNYRLYRNYRQLSFGKIILYLHETKRKPDAMPGYSILVFDLSDDEVRNALSSPSKPIRK
ncbi:MAG: hypothetical protein A2020_01020 [Lentisphaerae bacterium GWF2_45_14]|nr:MAG: hypothetical protein A2020_01020 [Lentisphaerae bacterium GWF2_45_14]